MLEIFQYSFFIRGLEAGIIVGAIAPLIGIFLVLRRYSLITDTLAHVSLSGIALSFILGTNPVGTALVVTVLSSIGIERLRSTRKIFGESALALFLSGSLALATVLLSVGNGFKANLFNYLFGSIVTVTRGDIQIIASLSVIAIIVLVLFFKELIFVSFDEEAAKVSGLPVKLINTILILLAALLISLSIPIVGALLIAALIVIPVITALLFQKTFLRTIVYAEIISLFSVITGILLSFYLNLSAGGTIVLLMLAIFIIAFTYSRKSA